MARGERRLFVVTRIGATAGAGAAMARWERSEATVRRAARRLPLQADVGNEDDAASAVTRTSTVAECAEGGRRVANGARQTPRGWWRRCTKRLPRLVERV